MKPSKYYKTDATFHNHFLEVLEDCIAESDLPTTQKEEMIMALYRKFHEAKYERKSVKPSFEPRYIMV